MLIFINAKTLFFKRFIAVIGYVYVCNRMEYSYINTLLYTFIKHFYCL